MYNGGNELNENSGWYETFFREYDASLGRFMQVDPLAGSFGSHSPCHYAYNYPMLYNDVMGDSSERFGPGSGNHWSDGSRYSDWSANGGSQMYRDGLAAGLVDIGGTLYDISNGYRTPATEHNGQLGILYDSYTDWYVNGEYVDSYYTHTYFKPVSAQQKTPDPGIDYGNFVDPASLNLNQLGPYYQTNANYSESYWKGMPRPGYMKVSVPNIGIMITPRDINWDAATIKQKLAKAFDFARGSLYDTYKAGEVNSTNASASFLEFLNLGIEIHVGFGRAVQGMTLTAPVSNITFKGIWALPSVN